MKTIKTNIGSKRVVYTHTNNNGVTNIDVEIEDVDRFAYVTPINKKLADTFKQMDEQIAVFDKFLNELFKHNK
jgi:hypothetical protein